MSDGATGSETQLGGVGGKKSARGQCFSIFTGLQNFRSRWSRGCVGLNNWNNNSNPEEGKHDTTSLIA